jgi:hypothetical protein
MPTSPRQMGRTCRKEKQLAQTVRPKTLIKKGATKSERTYLGEKILGAGKLRCKARRTKGNVSSVGPAQLKGKLRPIYTLIFPLFRATVTVSAVRILVARPSLHFITFSQPLPACASGPIAPGPRADSTPPLRFPLQLVSAAAAAAAALQLPPPPHSTSRRHQPVSPASPGPLMYARCPVPPPLCSLTPLPRGLRECRRRRPPKHVPRDPAPGTPRAAATRSSCPGYPVPDTLHAAAAAAALASPFPRRLRECRRRRHPWSVPRVPRPRYDLRRCHRRSRGRIHLPWPHPSHDRADTSHCHRPHCRVRPPLTELSAELSLLSEGDLVPFYSLF